MDQFQRHCMNCSPSYTCFYDRKKTPIVDVIVMIINNIIYVGISSYTYNYYYNDGVIQYSRNISISVGILLYYKS